jgi:hypothetical protein
MILAAGCSFTDPSWQLEIPWSTQLSDRIPLYIVAKAGMGIKGICTESMTYLQELPDVTTVIIMLPTLWRLDIEVDEETYLCNSMVDLLVANGNAVECVKPAHRKWLTSGGLHYDRSTEQAACFDFLYKHQGFLVILKEHLSALKQLVHYCKDRQIDYLITAIQDPLDQLQGLDYIKTQVQFLLNEVEYSNWFKFNGKFVDKFLRTREHPSTVQHKLICDKIYQELVLRNTV